MHVGFFGRDVQAELRHGMAPGIGMVGHGVEEDPVHIKKHGFKARRPKAVLH